MSHITLMLTLFAFASCKDPSGPLPPSGAVPLVPIPAEFAQWWQVVQECSGLSGNLSDITWLTMPGVDRLPVGEEGAAGAWYSRGNQILLAQGRERSGAVVRHEMLHALIGRGGHPRELFLERCGGVVPCDRNCLKEAGGPLTPDPRAVLVEASAMELRINVFPSALALPTDARRCVTFVVSARNVLDGPVKVRLGQGFGRGFSYEIEGRGSGEVVTNDTLIAFSRGTVRRQAFDHCPDGIRRNDWTGGEHLARGRLKEARSEAVPFFVVP